ncbi:MULTISPECIES: hypothetical protein [unclassified Sphingomonas]|uniref:hypothetical protein n=1 Tax=unclassified Sphingomonas TaxID=196159 RepID=UPI000831E71D|nr:MULTISPECIES: hypothetical protein [unclassified Sphingomonas]
MNEARIVAAARAAVGAPFRLHGRTIAHGLDCVGLVALALAGAGYSGPVPTGYALRTGESGIGDDWAKLAGLEPGPAGAGAILLAQAGPGQLHLAIDSGTGVIHADAWLRRVVERPGAPPWPIRRRWHYRTGLEDS